MCKACRRLERECHWQDLRATAAPRLPRRPNATACEACRARKVSLFPRSPRTTSCMTKDGQVVLMLSSLLPDPSDGWTFYLQSERRRRGHLWPPAAPGNSPSETAGTSDGVATPRSVRARGQRGEKVCSTGCRLEAGRTAKRPQWRDSHSASILPSETSDSRHLTQFACYRGILQ